jgi:hypothetical protein
VALQTREVVRVWGLRKKFWSEKSTGSQAVRMPPRVPSAGAQTYEEARLDGRKDFALNKSMF